MSVCGVEDCDGISCRPGLSDLPVVGGFMPGMSPDDEPGIMLPGIWPARVPGVSPIEPLFIEPLFIEPLLIEPLLIEPRPFAAAKACWFKLRVSARSRALAVFFFGAANAGALIKPAIMASAVNVLGVMPILLSCLSLHPFNPRTGRWLHGHANSKTDRPACAAKTWHQPGWPMAGVAGMNVTARRDTPAALLQQSRFAVALAALPRHDRNASENTGAER